MIMKIAINQIAVVHRNVDVMDKSSLDKENPDLYLSLDFDRSKNLDIKPETNDDTAGTLNTSGSKNNSDSTEERNNIVTQTVSFFSKIWQRKPKEEDTLEESVASMEDIATQITKNEGLWNKFKTELDDSQVVTRGGVLAVLDRFTREELDGSQTDDGKSVSYDKMKEASNRRRISKKQNLRASFGRDIDDDVDQLSQSTNSWFARVQAGLKDEISHSQRSLDCNNTHCQDSHSYHSYPQLPQVNGRPVIYKRGSTFDINNDSDIRSVKSAAPASVHERTKKGINDPKTRRRFSMVTSSRPEDFDSVRNIRKNNGFNVNDDIYVPEESRFGFMDRLREETVREDHTPLPRGNIPGTTQSKIKRNSRRASMAASICSDSSSEQSSIVSFNTMNADALRQSFEKGTENVKIVARRNSIL